MRSTFKTVFYVNGSKEKSGIVPIMGRVTINGRLLSSVVNRVYPRSYGMSKLIGLKVRAVSLWMLIMRLIISRRR